MKYLCLIYDDETNWIDATPEQQQATFAEHVALHEEATKAGAMAGGEGLAPSSEAIQLRVRDGKTIQTDGPFAELKEQLGGFYLFDCEDIEAAKKLAAKIPEARTGTIEIRRCMVFEG